MTITSLQSMRIETANDDEAINELFYDRGWTDGLPIVPPTEERVQRMLAAARRDPQEVVGRVAPRWGTATIEKIAINAVMAGCKPEYLPVVISAVRGLIDDEFNLGGVQGTTGPMAPLTIVNGPIARQLGINGGHNCFGQGWRANATIGRAIRLVLFNIGGGTPGQMDKATLGHPGKYTFCIAENEEQSPWEPLHVSRGFAPDNGTTTVMACDPPHVIVDNTATNARDLLSTIADTMCSIGSINFYMIARENQVLLVLGPEHAREIAREGWSKQDVQQYLYERARLPVRYLKGRGMYGNRTWPRWIESAGDEAQVPIANRPENILVVVAGGIGRLSAWLPTWSTTHAVTTLV